MTQSNVFRRLKPSIIGALYAVNAFCAVHLVLNYVGSIQLVSGPSMLPTMAQEGEAVIENRLSFRLNPDSLKRGDLVTFESPLTPGRLVCKRLLGLPGDIICVDPTGLKAPSSEHVVVPKGHIWLMGDNAVFSRDSRDYGPVPLSLVRGTLWARVYPFNRVTLFRNPTSFLN
ncbi:LexA/Signal peptidase [Multifurca ochricompacta]|uniref:LexA/Signal peptidase n=1 Tax=Multifurca ochricompacta TaxID=376703 RepID=A0AAD4MDY8_9AGAM|nr:LexA/Signal peptidase [Multifurca ochricompacta]